MSRFDASRRGFLARMLRVGAALTSVGSMLSGAGVLQLLAVSRARARTTLDALMRQAPPARYWIASDQAGVSCGSCHPEAGAPGRVHHSHDVPTVQCLLCPHRCVLEDGERGRCRARMNVGGQLRSLVYGRPISTHLDPIEKKPFYHFLPGSPAFSLATSGCPLRCLFCQNWQISQARPEDYESGFHTAAAVAEAVRRVQEGTVPVVAFTYNEPTVFFEYLIDIARAVRADGRRTVLISCGFVNAPPLADMLQVLDAVKFDLKGFDPEFYRRVSGAELEPVLRSIKQAHASGRHLELVNLVIPTLNDAEWQLRDLAHWVVTELGPDVPIHFTRFHPDYRLRHLPATPVATLERARAIAMDQGIRYAYVGNVPGHPGNHTYCPTCHQICIRRQGFFVTERHLVDGCCTRCGTHIAGVWE